MRGEGLGGRLLRLPHANLVVVAGPRLEPGWPALVGKGRRGTARLFTDCHAPAVEPAAAVGMLVAGDLPSPAEPVEELWRFAPPHLGHFLAGSHYRLALLLAAPAIAQEVRSSTFATGFDDVRLVEPGGHGGAALGAAAAHLAECARQADRPWFLFAYLPGEDGLLEAIAALMATTSFRNTMLVVYDTGLGGTGPTRRTPLWLERPGRPGPINPGSVVYPHLVSPVDLPLTLLGETTPASPIARDLWTRAGGLRGDLLAATLGVGGQVDDEVAAACLLRLAATRGAPAPGRFEPVSFVVAVDDPAELHNNLLRCPLARHSEHQWLLIDNTQGAYPSISCLYDDAYGRAVNDLVLFCHQDLLLPEGWEALFFSALADLERADPAWGVIGSVGVVPHPPTASQEPLRRASRLRGHWADPRGHHYAGPLPHAVDCLDEMWLGLRKRSGVRFDRDLPGFHCYGIDLSLTARRTGRRSYALDSFVWHKHRDAQGRVITRPQESTRIRQRSGEQFRQRYAQSYDYVAGKWGQMRPFASTSADWPACPPGPGLPAPDGPRKARGSAAEGSAHPTPPPGRMR